MNSLRQFVYRLPLIRGLLKRLSDLERQVADLQARLAALEAQGVARSMTSAGQDEAAIVYGKRILWEVPVQLCIKDFLDEGSCAIDVGANIGGVSIALSRMVGKKGQVHAFEANPFLIPRLLRDLEANEAANVVVNAKAAWLRSGEYLPLYLDDSYYASASSLTRCISERRVMVESISLDDYCEHRGVVPAVIKLDVEGSEYQVLLGAQRMLKKYSPVVVFEYRPSSEGDPADFLQSLGYVLYDANLYSQVDKQWYIAKFHTPPLCNVFAVPACLSSAFSVSVIPEQEVSSTEITIAEPGRYIVAVEFDAPDNLRGRLKVASTLDGELLAYYEATFEHLKQHSCSHMVFEVEKACNAQVFCEAADRDHSEEIRIRRVRLWRVQTKLTRSMANA